MPARDRPLMMSVIGGYLRSDHMIHWRMRISLALVAALTVIAAICGDIFSSYW
jgi:hypothetical protein